MAKARQQYFADEASISKDSREFAITPELLEKINSIEPGAQVNVIETVKVNGEALEPDDEKAVDVSVPLVEDTLYSADTTAALSAKQGKVLYEYIQNISSRGRYLSNWNCVTGLAMTNPVDNPYNYMAGDYYVISVVAAQGGTNYRPNGSQYTTGLASTTVETEIVKPGDYYTYDGTNWLLLINTAREIAVDSELSASSTNPVENRVVTGALNAKQNVITDLSTIRSGAAAGATALQPGDSLSQLTGDSDDITEGSTHLFMTTSERTKLSNQSGVNTGDETQTTIMSKLGAASSSTNGYLTSTDWNTFNGKQDAISDLSTIRDNATAGASAASTIATYGDIVTHDANEFASASSGALADTAVQPGDNVSVLTNDAGYVTDAYHDNTKQDKLVAGSNIQIASDGVTISATDTKYTDSDFDISLLSDSQGKRTEWDAKQDTLVAGNNIQIAADGVTVSATDTTYTAGPGISISNNNVISSIDDSSVWGQITGNINDQTDLKNALDSKQGNLTAGANIHLVGNTISADDTTYTAGSGISIDDNNVISNTQTSAEWGNIIGTLSDQTDLKNALDDKQDELIAGANIQIASDGKTISATDTTYTAGDFDIKDLADSTGKRASWDAKQDAISDLATIRSNASTAIQPNDNISELTNDAGYITITDIPALDTAMSSTSTNGVQNKVIKSYVDTQVQEATAGAISDTAYDSSWDGVTGIAPSKNVVYDKISAMDTTISGKQNTISDLSTIRSGAALGATSIQPNDNVSSLTNDAGYITKAVSDLTNYYTKTETYTKTEVDNKVANFAGFKVVATLPTTDIKTNIIYLLGPVGSGADKYEEYIYSNNTWIKIGETSVDLTNYFNTSTQTADNITEGNTNLFLTGTERNKLTNTSGINTGDETKTTIQTKLGASSASNGGYLTSTDWNTFNGKQDALTAGTGIDITDGVISNTQTSAEWGNIQGTLSDQTDLNTALGNKANTSDVLTKTNTTSYTPSDEYHPATKKYVDDNIASATSGAVSDTAYASSWNGVTGIAPSKNAVYDKISAMDTTISGKANASDVNTRTFYVSSTSDTAGMQRVINYLDTGNNPIVDYGDSKYTLYAIRNETAGKVFYFYALSNDTGSGTKDNLQQKILMITQSSGGTYSMTTSTLTLKDIFLSKTNTTSYTPTANYHPATKKYVDDTSAGKVSDTAYASSWNGVTTIAPSKNAVYDKISAMDTTIAGKQATIADLSDIRAGASAGATAIQPNDNISLLNNNAGYITSSSLPTKTSDLTNDSGFITNAVNNLTNYYTKSETYTKTEVDNKVANFAGFKVVATLPTTDIKTNIIYLVGPTGTLPDKYDEYIYSNNAWVKIGETSVDLTNYFNTSTQTSDNITQGSTNLFLTSAERTKLSNTSGTNTGDETTATIKTKLGAASASADGYLKKEDFATFNGKQDALATQTAYTSKGTASKVPQITTNTLGQVTGITEVSISYPSQVSDTAYASSWNGVTSTAPSKNAVYDKISAMDTTIGNKANTSDVVLKNSDATQLITATNSSVTVDTPLSLKSNTTTAYMALNGSGGFLGSYGVTSDKKPTFYNGSSHQLAYTTDIPTVNNGTLTITQNGTSKGTFTANQSGTSTIALTDTTYDTMSASELNTGTSTTGRLVSAALLSSAIGGRVSNTAYDSSWANVTTTAPSKQAVYNKISAMDTTISNKANATDLNTKTFYLSSTSDLTNAQAAYDWWSAGKNPVVIIGNDVFCNAKNVNGNLQLESKIYITEGVSYNTLVRYLYTFVVNGSGNVTSITATPTYIGAYLDTGIAYSTVYTPIADSSPATKKYVDDAISQSSGGLQCAPNSPIEIKYIWAGTQEQYDALSTYREDTIYHIV